MFPFHALAVIGHGTNGTSRIGKQSCVQCNGDDFYVVSLCLETKHYFGCEFRHDKKWIENSRKHKYPIHYIQIKIGVEKGC